MSRYQSATRTLLAILAYQQQSLLRNQALQSLMSELTELATTVCKRVACRLKDDWISWKYELWLLMKQWAKKDTLRT
jgi:hypothetical protein